MTKMNDKVNELRKNLIIESADKYFQEFGYEKTQIEKISKELSIGVGTIYSYFGSKEGLFLAWLSSIVDKAYGELLAKNVTEPIEKLKWFVEYKLDYYEKNKSTLRDYVYNNKLALMQNNPVNKLYNYIADGIKDCCPNKDCHVLAVVLDNVVNSYIEASSGDLSEKKDEIVAVFMRILEL